MKFLNKRKKSVVLRLNFLYIFMFAVSFLIAFGLIYYLADAYLEKTEDYWMAGDLKEVCNSIQTHKFDPKIAAKEMNEEATARGTNFVFFSMKDRDGRLLASSSSKLWRSLKEMVKVSKCHVLKEGRTKHFDTVHVEGREHNVRVCCLHDHASGYTFQMAVSLETRDRFLNNIWWVLVVVYLLVLSISSILCFFIIKKILAPVQSMTRFAQKISIKMLDHRIPVEGSGDELDRLAVTLNEMLGRIEELVKEIKRISDDLAHNLRTPISRMRGSGEVALLKERTCEEYREVIENYVTECDKILNILNTLLDISEIGVGVISIDKQNSEINSMVREIVEIFKSIAEYKNITLNYKDSDPVYIPVDSRRLQQAVVNLVDNALKYTPSGGNITVSVLSEPDRVIIKVKDSGIGIVDKELPHIYERFYRAENSRFTPGSGLGLSFVKAVVEAHKGSIKVESQPGQGSTFEIYLPQNIF